MPKLLPIDDEAGIRHALLKAFHPPEQDTAADRPDVVVLLDVHLPDAPGLRAVVRPPLPAARSPCAPPSHSDLLTQPTTASRSQGPLGLTFLDPRPKPDRTPVLLSRRTGCTTTAAVRPVFARSRDYLRGCGRGPSDTPPPAV